jgi:hypothetical protein
MKIKLLWIVLLFTLVSGCKVQDLMETKKSIAAPKIIPGEGVITGRLTDSAGKPVRKMSIHLAEVYRSGKTIAYLVDSGNNLAAVSTKKGIFRFEDVPAGEYILWVGDLMSGHQIILDESGNPQIQVVQGDTVLELDAFVLHP